MDQELTRTFSTYVRAAERPENRFDDPLLRTPHEALAAAVEAYLATAATQMVPHGPTGHLVISVKTRDWIDDYDKRYDAQVKAILSGAERVWDAWQAYIRALRSLYPEIVVRVA